MTRMLTDRYEENTRMLAEVLRVGKCFDLVVKTLVVGGRRATLYFVDGFVKDETMEKMLEFWMKAQPDELAALPDAEAFGERFASYVETDTEERLDAVVTGVLSGTLALVIEGYAKAVLIDARTYPARGVDEPEADKALRGARDGFVETLVFNTAMVRRRVRDPRLTMEIFQIGKKSRTDVVLCYMEGLAKPELVGWLRNRLRSITIGSLTMGQESLAECLVRRQWWNPFPRVRYTERPDAAAANVLEGKILLIVDNSPAVMLLPTSLFDFGQDTNDFYFPPLVGTYLRLVRLATFALTVFLTPVWYLLIQNPDWIPSWLDFIRIREPNSVPVIVQLLLIEFVIDGLKLASLNTPSVLSNSFSVVGALILGDFAVQARWFVPEVVLYMAFVAIANFTQPSYELGYAFKLFRILTLALTALLGVWGFGGGILLMLLTAACTKPIVGPSYLFPLIPWNGRAFAALLFRRAINRDDS